MTGDSRVELLHVVTDGRPGGRVAVIAAHIEQWCASRPGVHLNALDPASAGSEPSLIDSSNAVVLTTPIYKASFAGSLKTWLDFLPVRALWWKPTAIIGVGASDRHYLALDSQLRFTLTWFGALCLPVSVYLTPADVVDGVLTDSTTSDIDGLVDVACELAGRVAELKQLGPSPLAERR